MNASEIFRKATHGSILLGTLFAAACASSSGGSSAVDPNSSDRVRIGYGTQDEGNITGAVESVTAEEMEGREVTRIEDMIDGRFAGVYVQRLQDGGISLRIRGTSSFMGGGEPLLVIDGMTIQGGTSSALRAVNPRDITRIDVLKDAGSTAIYGSRGGNGVILITTRRGQ